MIAQEVYYIALSLDEIRQAYIEVNGSDKKIAELKYCVPDDGGLPIIWLSEIDESGTDLTEVKIMSKYELTQNGTKVGIYENGSLALEAMEDELRKAGGNYHPKVNHTAVDCETEEEITTIIYQTDDGVQQVFLIEKINVVED